MRPILTALLASLVLAASAITGAAGVVTQTKQTQQALTPDAALQILREGNARFVAGTTLRRDLARQVRETSDGQYPFAAVLGCVDSRVSPELVFDTGLGDVFSARVAGNVLDDPLLGSLEFATQVAGARLIVVLGHTHCGAVKGACDGVKLGHLTETLALLQPALDAAKDVPGPHTSANEQYVSRVTEANVRGVARRMVEQSPILAELVRSGRLRVVPALYDLADGHVSFLE